MQTDDARYRALIASDRRFDGLFFVGISTTGIYCRPVCPARKAKRSSCTFFNTAAAAEADGYRPCRRCRPEIAPVLGPYGINGDRTAGVITDIQHGGLNGNRSLEELAARHQMSTRQLRRVVQQATGASPIQIAQTARLLLAKQLLTETTRPISDIAFASGFSSVRRFNELFATTYRISPSDFRGGARGRKSASELVLRLGYRPPLAWKQLLQFIGPRSIEGVEHVDEHTYRRTISIDGNAGWFEIEHDDAHHQLVARVGPALIPVLQPLLARMRDLFDLHARPDVIDGHLAAQPILKKLVSNTPGRRVPGCVDTFELAWRTVLGQQVSVTGASTLAARFARRFGQVTKTPLDKLSLLTPTAQRVARARVDRIASLGMPKARAETLIEVAKLFRDDENLLTPGADPDAVRNRLQSLRGVGPWTAHYIVMRGLHWPDAFPESDLGVKKALEAKGIGHSRDVTNAWSPWRSYATMHLWASLKGTTK